MRQVDNGEVLEQNLVCQAEAVMDGVIPGIWRAGVRSVSTARSTAPGRKRGKVTQRP
jgi:hypothetical protein